jgi:putative heme-binding domain-containing protein
MIRSVQVLICAGLALAAAPPMAAQSRGAAPPRRAAASSTEPSRGRIVFEAQCAWCHGNEGAGGMGPSLQGKLRQATTLASIVEIITAGIPGTDMPSFRSPLTERDIRQTAAYVQSLSRAAGRGAAGNAARGATVYRSNGCAACHIVQGDGGVLGPELTSIGARRGPAHLRESIVKPAAAHPTGYLVVRAVPESGPEVRGIRLNEDVFWIQIRDAAGSVHSLEKSALKSLDRELEASLMPSYAARLNDGEIDDLVAYLSTLRGAK